MNLTEQERGKRVAGRDQVVAAGVKPSCPEAIEGEVARGRAGSPAADWEVVMAELEPGLQGVAPLHPGEVVRELPAVVLLVAEPGPAFQPDGRIRDTPAVEPHRGRARVRRHQAADRSAHAFP